MKKTVFALAVLSLMACKKDNEPGGGSSEKKYTTGVFVSNEGVWNSGESTLSHFNDGNSEVTSTAFLDKNGFKLGGDVFQSMTIANGNAYMIINTQGVIEVADAQTLASKGQILGISSPRFMVSHEGMGYVSDWASDQIMVIDLTSNTVVDSIAVGVDPENMVVANGKLYVTNSSGGFGSPKDSTISIVDLSTKMEMQKVIVGDKPNSLQLDANGDLWILAGGNQDWSVPANNTIAKLVKMDLSDNSLTTLDFTAGTHPAKLEINAAGDKLYYLENGYGGALYEMSISASSLPATSLVSKSLYGVGIHPTDNMIYGGFSPAFDQDGWVFRYQMNGTLIDSFKVGIGPNGFEFL